MAPAVWKGLLRFGLVSIPIRLYRVAQAEKVSFRQLHKATGARVRHRLCTDSDTVVPIAGNDTNPDSAPAMGKANSRVPPLPLTCVAVAPRSEVRRQDVAKGYEYEKDRYVCISQAELAQLLPPTTHELELRGFVQPAEIELAYFESTFYVVPDGAGQHAYAMLFEALLHSGLAGVAQITMHSRE